MSVKARLLTVMILVNLAILGAGILILPSLWADRDIEAGLQGRANRISMSAVLLQSLSNMHQGADRVRVAVATGGDPAPGAARLREAQAALVAQLQFLTGSDEIDRLRIALDDETSRIEALLVPPISIEHAELLVAQTAQLETRAGRELQGFLSDNNSRGLNDALDEFGRLHGRLGLALFGVTSALALSILLCWLAYRRLVQPLGAVTASLNAVLTGRQPSQRLQETQDEIGDIVRAIHKLQAQGEHIRRVAYVDGGTGLPNRNGLDAALREVRRLRPIDGSHGLILLGVDSYNGVRSGFGFRFAEMMMRATADRLHALDSLPTQVYRLEPDVLAILVDRGIAEAVARADLKRVAAEAMSRLSLPVEVEEQRFLIGIAAGAAVFPDDAKDPEEYVNVCVEALRHARANGSGQLRFGERGHTHRLRKHLALSEQVRMGIREGQFLPFFQPVVDVAKRKVVGAEVLVRWRQPDGRVVLPVEFILIAEGSELIRDMTRAVLSQACRAVRGWSDRGLHLNVSFNLSAKLLSPDIVGMTREALRESGLPPSRLIAEITETALVHSLDEAAVVLDDLHRTGVRLCLDDFGTGYSSLSHLYRFQIDRIKIDPVICRASGQGERAAEIVRSMAELANRLSMSIVAEGVETEADLERLRRLGCTLQQGFLFSRAMPEEQFIEWVRRYEAGVQAA